MTNPRQLSATRVISLSSGQPNKVPLLTGDDSIFKGEIAVNHYKPNSELISSTAGIFIRVGEEVLEDSTDSLIRIGPAYVTDDAASSISPGILYQGADSGRLVETGQLWFRRTDEAFLVNNGKAWSRVSPLNASVTDKGIIQVATQQEVNNGLLFDKSVTPRTLQGWREELDLLTRRRGGYQIYIDQNLGDDSIENDGTDPYYPFLTIERALLEVARKSYVPDGLDIYDKATLVVQPGDYLIDNRPGVPNSTVLKELTVLSRGCIEPLQLQNVITEVDSITLTISFSRGFTQGIRANKQIFSSSGGKATVVSVTDSSIKVRNVYGDWKVGDTISIPQMYRFNPAEGGVVLPRGCSIVSADLRKSVVRPMYVGNVDAFIREDECFGNGRTAIFKVTGGSYLEKFTFKDNKEIKYTHHLCTCVEFASGQELDDPEFGYYQKVFRAFGKTVIPNFTSNELAVVNEENEIVTSVESNLDTDDDGFLSVNSVESASPYIFNCSVRSRFGLCGMLIDGSKVNGFKSMVTAQFTNVSLQNDGRAFELDLNEPGNLRYRPRWQHFSFKAINEGYAQIVSCFVIGTSVHFEVDSGGELSITNSCSNFGGISLRANQFRKTALPQDQGSFFTSLIPPKPLPVTRRNIAISSFLSEFTDFAKVYLQGDFEAQFISPYSLQPGEEVYCKKFNGTEISSKLVTEPPYYGNDANGYYLNVQQLDNSLYVERDNLDGLSLYIKRTPDDRKDEERIYWVKVEGINLQTQRAPTTNYIFRLDSERMGRQLSKTYFNGVVRSTDFDGNKLGEGVYYIALLSGDGKMDATYDIYPKVNYDSPNANPPQSLTYRALDSLLDELNFSGSQRSAILVPSIDPVDLGTTIYSEFNRPSIIRCSNHTWEWPGFGNYSTALPKFQDRVLSFESTRDRIKEELNGGRIYNVGMDNEGNFLIGSRLVDLKTGQEIDLNSGPTQDPNSRTFARLTVTERFTLASQALADFSVARLRFGIQSSFANPIPENSGVWASTSQAGFVELATNQEVLLGVDDKRAVTPAQLKAAIETGAGLAIGVIMMWPGSPDFTPAGWALCNGQTVICRDGLQRTTPDLRGRFIVGYDPNDTDYQTVGLSGGNKEISIPSETGPHTLSVEETPAHRHEVFVNTTNGGGGQREQTDGLLSKPGVAITGEDVGEKAFSLTNLNGQELINLTGGNQPHSHPLDVTGDNRPPYYVLVYIFKL